MAKIWEVDFSLFFGASLQHLADRIGSQHLTTVTPAGGPTKVFPLSGLTNRRGMIFPAAGTYWYNVSGASATNAYLSGTYGGVNRRSFELWFRPYEQMTADYMPVWSDYDGAPGGNFVMGLRLRMPVSPTTSVEVSVNNNWFSGPTVALNTWYHFVMTVDRLAANTKCYLNGVEFLDTTHVSPTTVYNERLGSPWTTGPGVQMGKAATYDTILTPTEISNLYNSFLEDVEEPSPLTSFSDGRIFEVDFTRNDPNNHAIDNVTLTPSISSINPMPQLTTLSGFTYRPGKHTTLGTYESEAFLFNTNEPHCPAAVFTTGNRRPYLRRSFVIWFRLTGNQEFVTPFTYRIWGESNSGDTAPRDGIFLYATSSTTSVIRLYLNTSNVYAHSSSVPQNVWQSVALTVDRIANQTILYINGSPVSTLANAPANTTNSARIVGMGDNNGSSEAPVQFGYAASYDRVLSSVEISALHANFLVDTEQPYLQFATISGTVRDSSNFTISGAKVVAYDHQLDQIINNTSTNNVGYYQIGFPRPGQYTLFSTKHGSVGGRASTVTVSGDGSVFINDEDFTP